MTILLYANNVNTALASPISSSSTVITVTPGTGSLFPSPSSGQSFRLTLNDASTGLIYEILNCTSRSGDLLTVQRAQEGTTAKSWDAGDKVGMFPTAGTMENLAQLSGATFTGELAYTNTLTGGTAIVNLGSGQFYKDSSGNVGIGTASPASQLEILKSQNADLSLRITNTNAGASARANLTMSGQASNYQIAVNDTYIRNYTNNNLYYQWYTNNTEKMRLTSDGNLGIGTSSPIDKIAIYGSDYQTLSITNIGSGNYTSSAHTDATLTFVSNLGYDHLYYNYVASRDQTSGHYNWSIGYGVPADTLNFCTGAVGNAERMRIASNGFVMVGTTTTPSNSLFYVAGSSGFGIDSSGASFNNDKAGFFLQQSDGNIVTSHRDNNPLGNFSTYQYGGVISGYVVGISGGAGVAYVSVSDYRLKEDVAPMTGALETVAKLKPVTYTWKSNGTKADGFIAHELQKVLPNAVSGEKDAVNEDGSIKPQGIDTSYVVATLTAAIQEQQVLIVNLQKRLTALENK